MSSNTLPIVNVRRVRLLCNWLTSAELEHLWAKMSMDHQQCKWLDISQSAQVPYEKTKNYYFYTDQQSALDEIDYFIIINSTTEPYIAERSLVFHMEPAIPDRPELWGEWHWPLTKNVRYIFPHQFERNIAEWHLTKTYKELKDNKPSFKLDQLSVILSQKTFEQNHQRRHVFARLLEEALHDNDQFRGFGTYYNQPLPLYEKDQGLFPFKYHFNCECKVINNYQTEKLYDAILAETLCFYCGPDDPILSQGAAAGCYVKLTLIDLEHDLQLVQQAINDNLYEERLPAIRAAKDIILDQLQFWPKLARLVRQIEEY
jgi:hypothetical protein